MDGDGLCEARNPTTGKTRPGGETKHGRCSRNIHPTVYLRLAKCGISSIATRREPGGLCPVEEVVGLPNAACTGEHDDMEGDGNLFKIDHSGKIVRF